MFLIFWFVKKGTGTIELTDQIELEDKILTQLEPNSHINKAYSFTSKDEITNYIETAKTLDKLYTKINSIWKEYIDADDFHISKCAADAIFIYFQDIIVLTHYLYFIGNNCSGKSNN